MGNYRKLTYAPGCTPFGPGHTQSSVPLESSHGIWNVKLCEDDC